MGWSLKACMPCDKANFYSSIREFRIFESIECFDRKIALRIDLNSKHYSRSIRSFEYPHSSTKKPLIQYTRLQWWKHERPGRRGDVHAVLGGHIQRMSTHHILHKKSEKFSIRKGVRQGDSISLKYAARMKLDSGKSGIRVWGAYLSCWRFGNDVFFSVSSYVNSLCKTESRLMGLLFLRFLTTHPRSVSTAAFKSYSSWSASFLRTKENVLPRFNLKCTW